MRSHSKRPKRVDVTKLPPTDPDNGPPNKMGRNNAGPGVIRGELDPNSSDHVVAMTQLKEQIASLQKQINQRDQQMLGKDKMVSMFGLFCSVRTIVAVVVVEICFAAAGVAVPSPGSIFNEFALFCLATFQITELKAKHFTMENELRNKMKAMEKEHETKIDTLNKKIQNQLKEIATLSKSSKRDRFANTRENANNSGSGTDSPSTQ